MSEAMLEVMSFDPNEFRKAPNDDAPALRRHVWRLLVEWLREKLGRSR